MDINLNKENKNMPDLPSLMSAQYKIANSYLRTGFRIKGCIFLLNLLIILIPLFGENNFFIWGVFLLSVCALFLEYYYQEKFSSSYKMGERIRKLDLIRKIFSSANNKAEEAYLLSKVDPLVIEMANNSPHKKSEYYSDREEKYERLVEHIQENSYWTSSLMNLYSKKLQKFFFAALLIIIISVVGGFFILSEIKSSETVVTLNISQYLALLVNTFFAFNLLSYYTSFKNKAEQLEDIDTKLENRKNNPELDELFINFAEYNCILYDAFPTPKSIYEKHEERLNQVWRIRVDSD